MREKKTRQRAKIPEIPAGPATNPFRTAKSRCTIIIKIYTHALTHSILIRNNTLNFSYCVAQNNNVTVVY